jgi:hypothetical protein
MSSTSSRNFLHRPANILGLQATDCVADHLGLPQIPFMLTDASADAENMLKLNYAWLESRLKHAIGGGYVSRC